MSDTLEAFRAYLEVEGLEPRSVQNYFNAVKAALEYDEEEPWRVLARRKIRPATKRLYRAALLRWARWRDDGTLEEALSSRAAVKMMRGGKGSLRSKIVTPLTEEQAEAFDEALDAYRDEEPVWLWPCLRLMTQLGLRAGADLAHVQREAVEEAQETGVLRIWTKRDRERDLAVEGIVDEELAALLELGDWDEVADLISPRSAKARRAAAAYEQVRRWVKRVADEAGLDADEVWTHRFRHTMARRLYDAEGDILDVKDFLGHSSVATTERYLRGSRTRRVGDALRRLKKEREE